MTKVGVIAPSCAHEHSAETDWARSSVSILRWPPGEQIRKLGASPVTPTAAILTLNSLAASRAFQRSATSNRLLPSEKSADSVVIGYHATYPAPRTAVNDGVI